MTSTRFLACYAAIFGTFPYLTLKITWLTGGTLGLTDPSFVHSPLLFVGNLVTAAMDATAIVLALALTYPWGRRIPAPLVLFPAWVGTGLLGPIVLVSPVIGVDLFAVPHGELPLQDWVWGVVYGGFAWQGVALLTAFVFYVRDRWPALRSGAYEPRGSALRWVASGAAIGTAVLHLAWAFGSTFALVPGRTGTMSSHVMDGVFGVLTLLAVLASATRGALWPRLVVIWLGTGSMFGWGAWMLFATLTGGPLAAGSTLIQAVAYTVQLVAAVALLAGVRQVSYRGSRSGTDALALAAR